MPARQGYGGRPYLGPRRRMMTALQLDQAEFVEDRAEAADTSYSDVIAALVRVGMAHLDELPVWLQPKEVLPETA